MSESSSSGGVPWHRRLMFWRHDAVEERVRRGNFTADNGYSCYAESRGLSFISFAWIKRWIGAVAYGNLDYEKYPELPVSDFDTFAATEMSLYLMEARTRPRGRIFNSLVGNIRFALLRVFRHSFAYMMLLTILKDVLELFVVDMLKNVVGNMSLNSTSAIVSYTFSVALIAGVIAVDAFVEAYHHFYYRRLSLRIETVLHTLLFSKILAKERRNAFSLSSLSSRSQGSRNSGSSLSSDSCLSYGSEESEEVSILNLALFDVHEISSGVLRVVDLLNVPLKVFMLSLWLYKQMGWIAVHSLGLVGVCILIMLLCDCQCAVLLKEYVRRMDLRLFKTQVVLEDLRNLRLVRWIGYAMDSVMTSRVHELQLCLKRAYLSAISSWVGMASPYLMALFIFVISAKTKSPILIGMNLDKSLAFPLLHALNHFIRPLKRLPSDINDHMETSLSCRRLESYVYKKVLDMHIATPYDRFSERVAYSSTECRHPFKVDATLFREGRKRTFLSIAFKKIKNHVPLWMFFGRSPPSPIESSRSISNAHVSFDDPNWSFVRSRESITVDSELLRDSFMGITYPHVVQFTEASFAWNSDPVLENVNLTLRGNEVTFLMGPPGSGKTSLLGAILGDLQLLCGSVCVVPWEVNLPIGYVAQEPWIPVGTVRECILFGHVMDTTVYNAVVNASGLDVDFASWEERDLRALDEGGQSLSTGQRMRLSLARCLYNQMMHANNVHYAAYTLYCLDDLFAVLDPVLSLRIFTALFGPGGLLVGSSVIMVVQESLLEMLRASGADLSSMEFRVYQLTETKSAPRNETLEQYLANHVPVSPSSRGLSPDANEIDVDAKCDADLTPATDGSPLKNSPTKLVDSNQSQGALKLSNFMWIFNHIGITTVLVMVVLSFVSVFLSIACDQVIRRWSMVVEASRCALPGAEGVTDPDHLNLLSQTYDASMRSKLNHYYVYTLLNTLKVVICLCICFIEPLGTFQAARTTYQSAFGGVLRSPWTVISGMRIGIINNRLTTDQTYVDYNILSRFSHTTAMVLYATMSIVTVFVLNWWSGITLPIVLFLTYIVVVRDYLPMSRENMRAVLGTRAALCTIISQTITGSSVIRSARRERIAMTQFLRYLNAHERSKFFHSTAVAWSNVRIRLLSFPLIFANLVSPLLELLKKSPEECGTAMSADVSTALLYSMKLSKTLKSVISMTVDVSNTTCACQRLQDLSRLDPQYRARFERLRWPCVKCGREEDNGAHVDHQELGPVKFTPSRTGVEIKNAVVDYEYLAALAAPSAQPPSPPVLSQVDSPHRVSMSCGHMIFPPGEHVGIVGRTGSGKSTLLSALAGAVELLQGSIELDGVDISLLSAMENCNAIGNIPHSPPLLVHWTVRNYVDPRNEWDDVAIWDALYACSVGSYVRRLPGPSPLDVVLKKSWQNKCQGSKKHSEQLDAPSVAVLDVHLQYLNLARLLLYKRELRMLLVDESSLVGHSDAGSLTPIHELIHRLFRDCNLFLVAHHAESLQLCDRILVLDGGRVVGECSGADVADQQELAALCRESARSARPPFAAVVERCVAMSYGWLSESTIAPRKARSLQVPKGSVSVLQRIISKHTSSGGSSAPAAKSRRPKDPFEQKNPGVELRNRVDRVGQSPAAERVRARLEAKARLYDSIAEGRVSELPEGMEVLVDFASKKELDDAACTVEKPGGVTLLQKEPVPEIGSEPEARANDESLDSVRDGARPALVVGRGRGRARNVAPRHLVGDLPGSLSARVRKARGADAARPPRRLVQRRTGRRVGQAESARRPLADEWCGPVHLKPTFRRLLHGPGANGARIRLRERRSNVQRPQRPPADVGDVGALPAADRAPGAIRAAGAGGDDTEPHPVRIVRDVDSRPSGDVLRDATLRILGGDVAEHCASGRPVLRPCAAHREVSRRCRRL
ncbi:ABC transporter [Babesia caballi]|uniref:ABC transporter n=1 Tax=Babesia caballi TaxID=5871 RepID=A0AAV4LWN3_BABCB|nr:ABC transporter [Babesia caballi]